MKTFRQDIAFENCRSLIGSEIFLFSKSLQHVKQSIYLQDNPAKLKVLLLLLVRCRVSDNVNRFSSQWYLENLELSSSCRFKKLLMQGNGNWFGTLSSPAFAEFADVIFSERKEKNYVQDDSIGSENAFAIRRSERILIMCHILHELL